MPIGVWMNESSVLNLFRGRDIRKKCVEGNKKYNKQTGCHKFIIEAVYVIR